MTVESSKQRSIQEQRHIASQQSLGLSDNVIYQSVYRLLRDKKLYQGKILDYGAGQGVFLQTLPQDLDYEKHAIDLMSSSVPGVEWHSYDLNEELPFSQNHFDLITAIEVVEHLENPRRMVRDIYGILKPGGRIVVTTPNNESYRSLLSYIFRGHFVDFTESSYPAHITALNRADLKHILQEAGFQKVEFAYTNKGHLPKLTSLTWQKISFGLLNGHRYSDNILVTAIK